MDVHLAAQTLFTIAGFPVTNAFLAVLGISVLLIVFMWRATRKMNDVPKGAQFWGEILVMEGLDFMTSITGTRERAKKMLPFIVTMFLVFLLANYLAFLPGIGALTYNGIPVYRTATSDYAFVFTMAVLSVIIMQIITIATGSLKVYITKYLNVSGPWSMKPINLFLGLMDIVSEFAKIISLSFRLFGNIFAGEVLGAVVAGLLPVILPIPFALLGTLTALIQATVFSILVLIFMNMSVVEQQIAQEYEKTSSRE